MPRLSCCHVPTLLALPVALVALVACGDEGGPAGLGGGSSLQGQWTMSVTAVNFGRDCTVSGASLTFSQTGAELEGSLDGGGQDLVCVLGNGSTENNPLPGPTPFDRVSVSGNGVQFVIDGEGAQDNGGWVLNGTRDGDDSMGGTIAFRIEVAGGFSTTIGEWTAVR